MINLKDIYLKLKEYEGRYSLELPYYERCLIVDAIERLIPVKAIPNKNSLTGKQEYNYWVCPNCNQTFAGMLDYCYHCGQALNWKESIYDNE